MENVTVGVVLVPLQIIDVLDALNVHGETLETIRDLRGHRLDVLRTDLLEICELRNLHAIEPNLPAETPSPQGRRLPVVLDKAHIVLLQIDAEAFQRCQIQLLNIVRRRLHNHLELMMLVEAVRVVAIAAIRRAAARLHIGDMPGLRPQHAQEGRRVHRAGTLLHIVGLRQDAALLRPKLLQGQDDFLIVHVEKLLLTLLQTIK